jgi:hypothetical protein
MSLASIGLILGRRLSQRRNGSVPSGVMSRFWSQAAARERQRDKSWKDKPEVKLTRRDD